MKLVMCFAIGDGCSWSCDETIPIEYESPEALICDFMDAAREVYKNKTYPFVFLGQEFSVETFIRYSEVPNKVTKQYKLYEDPPEIYTLEEWFESHKIKGQLT